LQEVLDDVGVALLARVMQRSVPIVVCSVHICPSLESLID